MFSDTYVVKTRFKHWQGGFAEPGQEFTFPPTSRGSIRERMCMMGFLDKVTHLLADDVPAKKRGRPKKVNN